MMKVLWRVILSVILLAVVPPHSASAAIGDEWDIWTNPNFINEIAAVGDTLWCATSGGIVRYDMITGDYDVFTTMDGLSTNYVRYLAADPDGGVWFNTAEMYVHYTAGKWAFHTGPPAEGIAVGPDGVFWATTRDNVVSFDGSEWREYDFFDDYGTRMDFFSSIEVDADNTIWIACQDGLIRFRDGEYVLLERTDDLPLHAINALLTDSDGHILVCAQNKIITYDENEPIVTEFDVTPYALITDASGDVWIGASNGFWRCDGDSLIAYDITVGQDRQWVTGLAGDSRGRIWYSLNSYYDIGLRYYDGGTMGDVFFDTGVLYNDVSALAVDARNALWIGTYYPHLMGTFPVFGGVTRYDGSAWTHFTSGDSGYGSCRFETITIDGNDTVWCGLVWNGVSAYDGVSWRRFLFTAPDGSYYNFTASSIAFEDDGTGWFALGGNGVARYDGSEMTVLTEDDGFPADIVNAVAVDRDGVVWFASGGDVLAYDGSTWETFSTEMLIPYPLISEIAVDIDNTKWIAYPGFDYGNEPVPGGLVRYDGRTWTTFTSDDGLPSDYVNTVAVGHDHDIWVGTNGGVARYDGEHWQRWSVVDGLADNVVRSIAVDHDGIVWIGTERGLSRLRPGEETLVEENASRPRTVSITGVFPNPFNASVTIFFECGVSAFTRLDVYNVLGQKVRTLVSERLVAGEHRIVWNGCNDYGTAVSNGVYFVRCVSGGMQDVRKIAYVK